VRESLSSLNFPKKEDDRGEKNFKTTSTERKPAHCRAAQGAKQSEEGKILRVFLPHSLVALGPLSRIDRAHHMHDTHKEERKKIGMTSEREERRKKT
jgi:hypothetical protein